MKMKGQHVDSPEGRVAIAQAATRELLPPDHVPLQPYEMPFWHSVIAEYSRSQWSSHQLEIAAMLARNMFGLEQEQRTLAEEGYVIQNFRGTNIENPRARVMMSLTSSILAQRRSLCITPQSNDTGQNIKNKRTRALEIEGEFLAAAEEETDDLLARPRIAA